MRCLSGRLSPRKLQQRLPHRTPSKVASSKWHLRAASSSSNLPVLQPIRERAKQQVMELLAQGVGTYSDSRELGLAIDMLIQGNPTSHPGPDSFVLGQGIWEVFHAPHIARMSSVLATKFEPILYILQGEEIISNVQFNNPLVGSGWLSAAGSIKAKGAESLELDFQRFWVDVGADHLRKDVPPESPELSRTDQLIMSSGRAMFFPQFALFPVLYLDADIAVFQFPPLSSNIAIRRVA